VVPQIEESIIIEAPVERVFAYVADYRHALEWMHNFTRFEPVGEPTYGRGARVRAAGTVMGLPVEVTLEIVDFEPNRRLVSWSTGMVESRSAWLFEPLDGRTRVTFRGEYRLPVLLRPVEGRLMAELAENARRSLANLKRILEQPGDNPG
jgi:uncharacterized protein YndB with AHSA1/START domain